VSDVCGDLRIHQIGLRNPTSRSLVKAVSLGSAQTSSSALVPLTVIPFPVLRNGELRVDANGDAKDSQDEEGYSNTKNDWHPSRGVCKI
jgi:hypothetical protein